MPAALSDDSQNRDAERLWLPRWERRLAFFLALCTPFVCVPYEMVEVGGHPLATAVPCASQWDGEVGEDDSRDGVGQPYPDAQEYALPSFLDHAVAARVSKLMSLVDLTPASQVLDIPPPVPIFA